MLAADCGAVLGQAERFISGKARFPVKKLLLALTLAGLIGATMIGCGPTSTTPPVKKDDKEAPAAKLTVALDKKSVEIPAGSKADVKVTVTRDKFEDAVTVEFSELPKNVTVEGGAKQEFAKGTNDKTITLKAADDAEPVEAHKVKVTATGPKAELKATVDLSVTVKKKA